jgi:hypothetical protein
MIRSPRVSSLMWEATDLPEGKQDLPNSFVLDRKRDGRYKARLVKRALWQVAITSNRASTSMRNLFLCAPTVPCAHVACGGGAREFCAVSVGHTNCVPQRGAGAGSIHQGPSGR